MRFSEQEDVPEYDPAEQRREIAVKIAYDDGEFEPSDSSDFDDIDD